MEKILLHLVCSLVTKKSIRDLILGRGFYSVLGNELDVLVGKYYSLNLFCVFS